MPKVFVISYLEASYEDPDNELPHVVNVCSTLEKALTWIRTAYNVGVEDEDGETRYTDIEYDAETGRVHCATVYDEPGERPSSYFQIDEIFFQVDENEKM